MSSFEETLARMKGLYTYGKDLNENNKISTHSLEYHTIGADGKSYGIIRECNKYYIKSAPKDKELVAESYDYIGGFCNKKRYEYNSYANALKNLELKIASINEAYDGDVNISTLDPFKKEDVLLECTTEMKNEIARQRQIMHNASMIMNEESEIGATEKDNVVKYNGTNPETPKKNGNSINDGTDAKVVDQDKVKGKSGNKPNIVGPFNQKVNEGACCGKCGKHPCECQNCNEESGDISDEPLMPNTRNWAGPKMGASEPDMIGWDMDGQETVNEETNEWDEGLPSSAGIGEPNTKHNNNPFYKQINEDDDFSDENDDFSDEEDDFSSDEDNDNYFSLELDDTSNDEEDDLSDDEFSDEEDEFSDEEDNFSDEEDEFSDEFSDEEDEFSDEEDDFSDEEDEFSDEEDEFSDEEDEFSDEEDDENNISLELDDTSDDEYDEDDEFSDENEIDECGDFENLMEAKRRKMNNIVESVVKNIIKEDELHVFGKHPGYRKKPMELPTTGEDHNQWGRDWNDESVHNEEPFGKQIGNGDPFTELVNAVSKDVMYQLKKGVPINKKKVN